MQLRQSETVSLIDNQGIDIGHIQSRLDNRAADQDIGLALHKFRGDFFQFTFRHLPVSDGYSRFRNEMSQFIRHDFDGLHAVVHEKDLAVAFQFTQYGITNQTLVIFRNVGPDRQAVLRRRLHRAHIAHPHQRHM